MSVPASRIAEDDRGPEGLKRRRHARRPKSRRRRRKTGSSRAAQLAVDRVAVQTATQGSHGQEIRRHEGLSRVAAAREESGGGLQLVKECVSSTGNGALGISDVRSTGLRGHGGVHDRRGSDGVACTSGGIHDAARGAGVNGKRRRVLRSMTALPTIEEILETGDGASSVQPRDDVNGSRDTGLTGTGEIRGSDGEAGCDGIPAGEVAAVRDVASTVDLDNAVRPTRNDAVSSSDGTGRKRGLAVYAGKMASRERESTGVLRIAAAASTGQGVSPTGWLKALAMETGKANYEAASALQMRVADAVVAEQLKRETEDWKRRADKRKARDKRSKRTREQVEASKGTVQKNTGSTAKALMTHSKAWTSVRSASGHCDDMNNAIAEGVTLEANVGMPEPTAEFQVALDWSVRAVDVLRHVAIHQDALTNGLSKLALTEANRLESLAAGDVVGENETREGVAKQLVAAAAGLRAIATDDWDEVDAVPLNISRARRQFEKRVRKAQARERRKQLWQDAATLCPAGTFMTMDDKQKYGVKKARRLTKEEAYAVNTVLPHAEHALQKVAHRRSRQRGYQYRSGSVYEQPSVQAVTGQAQSARVGKLRAARAPVLDLLPTATVEVKGQKRSVKIDTGAQYCVAGKSWAAYGTKLAEPAPVDFMEGFSGVGVKVLGMWRFHFRTQYSQPMQVDALLVDCSSEDFLIGEDWMYSRGVKIDFTASEMKWYRGDEKVVVPFTGIGTLAPQQLPAAKVRIMKSTKVVTRTLHNVKMAVNAVDGTEGIFIPKPRPEAHLLLGPTVTKVEQGQVIVPVMSLLGKTTKLPARTALGTWTPMEDDAELHEIRGDLDRDTVKKWLREVLQPREEPLSNEADLIIGDMGEADKDMLLRLLRNYPKLIEPRSGCPPMTTLGIEHEIHTGTEAPVKVRPRRYARIEQEVIDAEVDKMLKNKVIEEGQGAWGFPVVLVKKKDGTVRFCIDYRLLNAVTKRDVYPLPRIDDTLESMHGAKRFTSLDLHAGYWQIPVALADRDKTGFITRRGLFRFIRMPFGLANAPGTFQRMMDAVLRGLSWRCCLVYLDDVIIYTKGNMARHVVELAAVLERLSKAGLSLKASKCSFGTTHLEYLGHELNADGVRPLDRLVTAVRDFTTPTDEASVKRFVHMAGFYRRFISGFGAKAAPLTKLLRKSSEWHWGNQQQQAFDQLKRELTEKPLLVYPDFSKPFKLVTDASVVGLGAALMQDQGHGPQPVAYASKVNSETVAKYNITDLECAAVVWAVKLFRPYLYGRRFQLVTDHSALKWLMTSKNLTGRLHRWALQLQEYDFQIEYRPGSTNVVADALSRAPVQPSVSAVGGASVRCEPSSGLHNMGATNTAPAGIEAAVPVATATTEVTQCGQVRVVLASATPPVAATARVSAEAEGSEIPRPEASIQSGSTVSPMVPRADTTAATAARATDLTGPMQPVAPTATEATLTESLVAPASATGTATMPKNSVAAVPPVNVGPVPVETPRADTIRNESIGDMTGTRGAITTEARISTVSSSTETAATPDTGQLTDLEIRQHQQGDKQIAKLLRTGRHGTRRIVTSDTGLVCVEMSTGERRVVLPGTLRHKALREAHDSIFA